GRLYPGAGAAGAWSDDGGHAGYARLLPGGDGRASRPGPDSSRQRPLDPARGAPRLPLRRRPVAGLLAGWRPLYERHAVCAPRRRMEVAKIGRRNRPVLFQLKNGEEGFAPPDLTIRLLALAWTNAYSSARRIHARGGSRYAK